MQQNADREFCSMVLHRTPAKLDNVGCLSHKLNLKLSILGYIIISLLPFPEKYSFPTSQKHLPKVPIFSSQKQATATSHAALHVRTPTYTRRYCSRTQQHLHQRKYSSSWKHIISQSVNKRFQAKKDGTTANATLSDDINGIPSTPVSNSCQSYFIVYENII